MRGGSIGCRCPQTSIQEQLLYKNVRRFRGELVFEAYRLLYHSTLGFRVIKKKMMERRLNTCRCLPADRGVLHGRARRVQRAVARVVRAVPAYRLGLRVWNFGLSLSLYIYIYIYSLSLSLSLSLHGRARRMQRAVARVVRAVPAYQEGSYVRL